MLVAEAKVEGLTLATRDSDIRRYDAQLPTDRAARMPASTASLTPAPPRRWPNAEHAVEHRLGRSPSISAGDHRGHREHVQTVGEGP
jgi:hypothetical protein